MNGNRTGFAPQPAEGSGPNGEFYASDILNDSGVPGANVKEALDELNDSAEASVIINQGETKTILGLDGTLYRTIAFIVSVNDDNSGDYFSAKLLAHHDGTGATHTQFAMIGNKTVKLFAEYAGGELQLRGTGLKDGQIVKAISFKVGV